MILLEAVAAAWIAGSGHAAPTNAAVKPVPAPATTIVSESTAARSARRAYDGAPPTIPHEPLGGECTACHGEEATEAGDAVAPAFPHAKTPGLSDASRCTQCHVYRNTEQLFRASGFTGDLQDVNRKGLRKTPKAAPQRPHRAFMREDCRVCHLGPGARPELVPKHGPRPKCEACHPTKEPD